MLKILREPFPYNDDTRQHFLTLLGVGSFVTLFLIYFEPFGLANTNLPNKSLYMAGYGVLTVLVFSLLHQTRFLFPNYFNEKSWTVGKYFFWLWVNLSVFFLVGFLYTSYIFNGGFSWRGFLQFYKNGMAIAIFPTVFLALLDYMQKLKQHQAISADINKNIAETKPETNAQSQLITLVDENKKEEFECLLADLLFIQSASNYVEIVYFKEQKIKKNILRNTLKNIEQQVTSTDLFRCHRSFLVNIQKVENITGNAQGYQLHFADAPDLEVPVARAKGKQILALI